MSSTAALDLRRDMRKELFASIQQETATLKRRQKKASAYEYRQDTSKLPSIGMKTVDISSLDPEHMEEALAALSGPVHPVPTSPSRAPPQPGDEPSSEPPGQASPSKTGAATETGGMASLDDYDPKEAATKEIEAIRKDIMAKRGEASHLHLELDRAVAELETTRTDLQQARYENNIEEQKRKGLEELQEAQARLDAVIEANDKEAVYQLTLQLMVERMRTDKIDHTKNMHLLEDALRVQKTELKLQQRLQRQAAAAKEKEETNLRALMEKHREMKKDLDTKLEARAQEVAIRQARREEREKRMAEEETLMARVEGDLTAKEEEQLKKRVARMKSEAKLVAQRLRFAVVKADKLEEQFNDVRVTAGATDASDGVEAGVSQLRHEQEHDPAALRYRPPNPKQVIHRFTVMQNEIAEAERQIADLSRRIAHLAHARNELRKAVQPAAVDPVEEASFSREERDRLAREAQECKREVSNQAMEIERLKRLKVFLGQSIDSIFSRLLHISPAVPLGERKPAPDVSLWAAAMHSKLQDTVHRLLFARAEIDKAQIKASVRASGTNDSELAIDPSLDRSDHLARSKHFEATIESVVTANEMGVRIPTQTAAKERARELGSKDFRTAAQQFTSTHLRAQKETRSQESQAPSIPALGMKSAQVASDPPPVAPSSPSKKTGASKEGKRKGPKAIEVTRCLAAAVAQTGQAVSENILHAMDEDVDDAIDRTHIKVLALQQVQAWEAADSAARNSQE